ncbi:MAG TPA: 4-hydroxy-3-methylbut-2-en-1-yl diphosphate synthase [Dehalococcoidia bacterium]|nr:4-hydroxy-3-methylbut-2-en-1-yl diphosphate synthase [Dehalococcoidia bacterium]
MITRRVATAVNIGKVTIGGAAPIAVQSMTKTDTRDAAATIAQICQLKDRGCEIIRVAVPDEEAAKALVSIKKNSPLPVIADIHFDHRLALAALRAHVDGLRLNPGNIRDPNHIAQIVKAAKQRNVPIRIGVNAGSLPPTTKQYDSIARRMVDAALSEIALLHKEDFGLIKVSLKAFDVPTTIEAYRIMAKETPYPLHVGITEAGPPKSGTIRSAVGIGILLHEGIGDTIRVSISADPVEEVDAAWEILRSLNLRERGPLLISCPTCGRSEVDILGLIAAVERELKQIDKPIKVAVMGCVVNGPGEAREADVGIACGKGKGVIFRHGEIVQTVDESNFLQTLLHEIRDLTEH